MSGIVMARIAAATIAFPNMPLAQLPGGLNSVRMLYSSVCQVTNLQLCGE
jgi:hypothetical protein